LAHCMRSPRSGGTGIQNGYAGIWQLNGAVGIEGGGQQKYGISAIPSICCPMTYGGGSGLGEGGYKGSSPGAGTPRKVIGVHI